MAQALGMQGWHSDASNRSIDSNGESKAMIFNDYSRTHAVIPAERSERRDPPLRRKDRRSWALPGAAVP
jgi:hypothetical protein